MAFEDRIGTEPGSLVLVRKKTFTKEEQDEADEQVAAMKRKIAEDRRRQETG